jgi:hypothetical protein
MYLETIEGQSAGPLFAPPQKPVSLRRTQGWSWRAARLAQRTPRWATVWKIEFAYATARLLRQSVDHVVPLHHPLVCGLHVEHNLQVMPMRENLIKGNSRWPDMWGAQELLL